MSVFLLRFEAIEARAASYSCPRGIASRLHAIRLRRHFQAPRGLRSAAIGDLRDWENGNHTIAQNSFNIDIPVALLQQLEASTQQPTNPSSTARSTKGSQGTETLTEIPFDIPERTGGSITGNEERGKYRKLPPHMARARYGDTFGLPFPDQHFSSDLDCDHFRKAIRTGNPHTILVALTKLIKVGKDGYKGHRILGSISPASFSEILQSLDPEHFVGRYVDLHRHISPTSPPYIALQSQKEHGLHHFRTDFIGRIRSIIEARRSRGFELSLIDYRYLLRCARAVGNPRAAHAVWVAMERQGIKPDTECYNHYLAAKVWSDLFNSAQRYKVRVLNKNLAMPERKPWTPGSGILLKHEITRMFDEMAQKGIAGDEETFCLLMIALARGGDLDGIQSVIMKGWGIDVDRLMTKDESSLKPPKHFAADSPFRPSKTLLLAIAHSFGINNAIPVALRLVDYVSRKYSLIIPSEVWEELLERTFVLSKRRTSRKNEEGHGVGQLPSEAVSNLWTALSSEPYNIKPTMAMYDRLIVNLLRRQRFGEVQERMEEALHLHVKAVRHYHEILALIEHQTPLHSIENDTNGHQATRDTASKGHLLDLQRDRAFQQLYVHRSRQYLRRWCRLFIHLGTRSMRHNPSFSGVTLPKFMQKYMSFMPREMEYFTPTGKVKFWSGSTNFNKTFIESREMKPWTSDSFLKIEKWPPKQIVPEKREAAGLDPLLESEEMFGKS
jgi:pentatricopeptide repeat protein